MLAVFDGHNDVLTRDDHALHGRRPVRRPPRPPADARGRRARGDLRGVHALGRRRARGAGAAGRWGDRVRARPAGGARGGGGGRERGRRPADRARAGRATCASRRSGADLDRALADGDGPPAAVLHLEGAEAIDPGLEALELWYEAGLRSIGPVWSRSNAFAHGVPFISPCSPDIGPGLTEAGRALARRCAELGILIDVSHLNEAGFWDLARIELGPIVACHSAAHALCPTSRNLTDAQIDAVGASGGLVGIVFAVRVPPGGLRRRPRHADLADRPACAVRRRSDRGGPRGARIRLRRRDDAGAARRRGGHAEAARRRSPTRGSARVSCARSGGTTGGACSARGGGTERLRARGARHPGAALATLRGRRRNHPAVDSPPLPIGNA